MNGGQSGNAFPACQCICNTQSPDALFAPPPCLRYIRQSIFAKQPETHYAGNDKAAVQKAEKENRNSAFTPAPAATYVCYTLLGKRRRYIQPAGNSGPHKLDHGAEIPAPYTAKNNAKVPEFQPYGQNQPKDSIKKHQTALKLSGAFWCARGNSNPGHPD